MNKSDQSKAEFADDFDLWMACYTQKEIAEKVGVSREAVGKIMVEMAELPKLPKSDQSKAEFADDFEIPIYNVWKFKERIVAV